MESIHKVSIRNVEQAKNGAAVYLKRFRYLKKNCTLVCSFFCIKMRKHNFFGVQSSYLSIRSLYFIRRLSRKKFGQNFFSKIGTRVEVPEIISAAQRCFRDLNFLSADSENLKNISAHQL